MTDARFLRIHQIEQVDFFNSQGHIMAVGDAHVFPGFLTPVPTQLSFPKPPTTFLTYFMQR